jgi:prepilin-type N-terminal cleavage/methylation domain-containing protein
MKRGFTLIELIISMSVLTIIMAGVFMASFALSKSTSSQIQEAQLNMQIQYALDNIKLHCMSAAQVYSTFPAGTTTTYPCTLGNCPHPFSFSGEINPYSVTPSIPSSYMQYSYTVDGQGNIVLQNTVTGANEILVGYQFNPTLSFTYEQGFEPNVLLITISGTAQEGGLVMPVSETRAVRFWFTSVVAT